MAEETRADPLGGNASKGESRERFGWGNLAERFRWDETVTWVETQKTDSPGPQGSSDIDGTVKRCGDAKPQESHRERTLLARRVRHADSQDGLKVMRG